MNKNARVSVIMEEKRNGEWDMEQLLEWMEIIEDVRQSRKVRHNIKDILVIVLFATLANAIPGWRSRILPSGMKNI